MLKTMHFSIPTQWLAITLLFVGGMVGCQSESASQGVPADVAAKHQELFVATEEPPSATPVSQAREAISNSEHPVEGEKIAVLGHIGGMPNPYRKNNLYPEFPWVAQSTVFFLVDPSTVEEFKQHPHEKGKECSFCMGLAEDLAHTAALVEFRDAEGNPLGYRADQLLGLREGARVVVEGTGKIVAETEMVIVADKIFVLDDSESL